MGIVYYEGRCATKDYAEAGKWFNKSAAQGHIHAAAALGQLYLDGEGVKQDSLQGVHWLRKAAEGERAVSLAQYNLGLCYYAGEGVTKDYGQTAMWCRKAAEQGRAEAQFVLARCRATGIGSTQDAADAAKWYLKAAEQGHIQAQYNIGLCLHSGDGVPQNWVEAVKWFRKAAAQGDVSAYAMLGFCYDKGEGVGEDNAQAAAWYRKAAEHGTALAQYNLGICYSRGEGVPRDYVEAYQWVSLAAAQDVEEAKTTLGLLEQSMTREQVAEAQRRTAVFVARKPGRSSGDEPIDVRPVKASGTGFFITQDGYLATCYHVVAEARLVRVSHAGKTYRATLVKADKANDVAVLKVEGVFTPGATFIFEEASQPPPAPKALPTFTALPISPSRGVKLGDSVFTIGFPNTEIQGTEPKLTRGEVSSLAGIQDDPRQFQISAAIQPGNSGGPLVDTNGNVVGIIMARLSDIATLRLTGTLPQNVNYALKSSFVSPFWRQ